ncbi:MAG: CotS family spore coat protein [Clostridiales bacterium]|nr:CotS family spore coat protein [Clostridiales bacterium]
MGEKSISVLEQYDLKVIRVGRGRGAVLCETNTGSKLLKVYTGSVQRLTFEDEVLNHINENGGFVDGFVRNKSNKLLSIDTDGTRYVLKNWYEGKECEVRNISDILTSVRTLATFHLWMTKVPFKEFKETNVYTATFLEDELEKHHRELKRARSFVRSKRKKSEFELYVINNYDLFYTQGEKALDLLKNSSYKRLMEEASEQVSLCHGNFNQHNIIFFNRNVAITNFDKMVVNIQLVDLYLLMRKILEKNNWDLILGSNMIEEYSKIKPISEEELEVLHILFLYPEKFWKIVNYYYNGNKAWIPQKNIDKLKTLTAQNRSREKFIEEVF